MKTGKYHKRIILCEEKKNKQKWEEYLTHGHTDEYTGKEQNNSNSFLSTWPNHVNKWLTAAAHINHHSHSILSSPSTYHMSVYLQQHTCGVYVYLWINKYMFRSGMKKKFPFCFRGRFDLGDKVEKSLMNLC